MKAKPVNNVIISRYFIS